MLKQSEIKSKLASIYQVESINAGFIRGIGADDSELHSTAISNWLDANPNANASTTSFWFGIYQAVLISQQFRKDTDKVKQGLIDAKCKIDTEKFDSLQNIRKFTVTHSSGIELVCTCSVLNNKTYVVLKKRVNNFSVPTHHISRYTVYYVDKVIKAIQNE